MWCDSLAARWWKGWCLAVLMLAMGAVLAPPATWASGPTADVVKVEEDWELVVAEPDLNLIAPQVTTAMSPFGNLDARHATIEVNHQSQPSFVGGGLQLQLWNGETPEISRKFPNSSKMQTANETVAWTQRMMVVGGILGFEVDDGTSTTWGNFGGQGYLSLGVTTSLADLNGYDPQVSVDNSGVGYASNRVTSLVLKEVRYYLADGTVVQDGTDRVVFSKN